MGQLQDLKRDSLLIVFENIQNEIPKILKFLFTEQHLNDFKNEYQQRIDCIKSKNMLPRTKWIKRTKIKKNDALYLTQDQFYAKINQKTICRMWRKMYSNIEKYDLLRWGYDEQIRKYNCTL